MSEIVTVETERHKWLADLRVGERVAMRRSLMEGYDIHFINKISPNKKKTRFGLGFKPGGEISFSCDERGIWKCGPYSFQEMIPVTSEILAENRRIRLKSKIRSLATDGKTLSALSESQLLEIVRIIEG